MTAYYYGDKPTISDEEFSLLKDELIWNGSKVGTSSGFRSRQPAPPGAPCCDISAACLVSSQRCRRAQGWRGTLVARAGACAAGLAPAGGLLGRCLADDQRQVQTLVVHHRGKTSSRLASAACLAVLCRLPSWMQMSSGSQRPAWQAPNDKPIMLKLHS